MNDNDTNFSGASDDEVLAAVRRRLGGVEPLVPIPPSWQPEAAGTGNAVRSFVRTPVRLGGLLSFGVIAALLVVTVGMGFAARNSSSGRATPVPSAVPTTTIVYQLGAVNGAQPAAADLSTTVQILEARLKSAGLTGAGVTAQAPDRVTVVVPGAVAPSSLQLLLGTKGSLEFVPLPPAMYGSYSLAGGAVVGTKSLPAVGDPIDPTLPAKFDDGQIDRNTAAAALDSDSRLWTIGFAFKPDAATEFATWSTANVGNYFAIVLDGKVVTVPYVAHPITGGQVQVAGSFDASAASYLAAVLKCGRLPFPLEVSFTSTPATPQPSLVTASFGPVVAPTVVTPTDLPSSGRTLGDPQAKVTLDVWVDFRCTACDDFSRTTMPKLIANYVKSGKIKIAYHDLLVIDSSAGGTESRDAANAARLAADQGKFWPYQDWLFANQSPSEANGAFTLERLVEMADRVGLDLSRFQTGLESGQHNAEVLAESAASNAVGVPAFEINGVEFVPPSLGADTYGSLAAAIDAALARVAASDAPTAVPSAVHSAGPSIAAPTAGPSIAAPTAGPSIAVPTAGPSIAAPSAGPSTLPPTAAPSA